MHKNKLISKAITPVNQITIRDLPAKLVELSDEALSQVCGGSGGCSWETQPIDGGGYYGPDGGGYYSPIEPFVPFVPVYNPNGDPFTHAP
jgi:hypothetical protein